MKKVKVSLFGVLAIFIAIAASSFTIQRSQKKTNSVDWFRYVSGPVDKASSYMISSTGDPECNDSEILCAIDVLNDGNDQPDQSALDFLYSHNSNLTEPVQGKVEFQPAP
jgi:hypothetical protein